MTPSGLYEWPDSFRSSVLVNFDAGTYGCAVWQWGEFLFNTQCWNGGEVPGATMNPGDCEDFIGYGPNTPMDLIFPAEGEAIERYVNISELNPAPDYVKLFFSVEFLEGPQGYFTTCETPNTEGGPRSGGCDGYMEPDVVLTLETDSGLGTFDGTTLKPPSELAYDASEEGSTLWPYGRLADTVVTASYSGASEPQSAAHSASIRYSTVAVPYWEIEPQEPTPNNSTITIGALVRGVRRKVSPVGVG